MLEIFDPFFNLLESGGSVLLILFFVGAVLVESVVERIYYYNKVFKEKVLERSKSFCNTQVKNDQEDLYLRQMEVSKLKQMLRKRLSSIQTLTYLFPLLGLLGTVTGMIAVFDVMAHKGLGNPRLMASGVSQATLPTMVGMVMALVGLFAMNYLKYRKTKLELELNETFKLKS